MTNILLSLNTELDKLEETILGFKESQLNITKIDFS